MELVSETLNFIENSKSVNHLDAYSVFKQKKMDNNWESLPISIIDYIKNDLQNTDLEQFIYE